jgi:hypothetical protein
MRDEQKIFPLIGETTNSIYPLAGEIMGPLFEKHFTEQRFYPPTFMAYNLSPKPLSATLVHKRTPYTNPDEVENTLVDAANAGYLKPDGVSGYLVAEKGTTAIETVHKSFYSHINKINQFPEDKLKTLIALLSKLVDASLKTDFASGIISLETTQYGHPKVEAGTLAQVDQLLDDLNAFRDDAHIAAWTPVGLSGRTWEVLTFVWNGEANTAEKLVERLPFRNYSAEDYTASLDDLTQRGWIEPGAEGYTVTVQGKKIREDAEADTNANFLGPWKVLSDDELTRLGELLTGLKETNLKLVEAVRTE